MAKTKKFDISLDSEEVVYTSISTSKDGYNSARIVAKKGDQQYISVSCEWEGDVIPGFVMDLVGFMKTNNVEKSSVWEGKESEYAEYLEKYNNK